jgi:hypothetical protein
VQSPFHFGDPPEVPGIVLASGTYASSCSILHRTATSPKIMNEKMNHLYALMLTVAAEKVERKGKTVLTFYEGRLGARR